ncbi:MAG: hypothetical protein E6J90_15200 [Deltaproteobacteria bacterium]|nr:MAG: hypothetical protein E6J91_37710 [Deltaproteobacteria bacterium]TMQ20887.1 MAG: hypothetical protein E6J90_15200 [Deltaproteobacteria bacterium]
MHDIGKTRQEFEMMNEYDQHELEGEALLGSLLGEAEAEYEAEHGGALGEVQEMELAAELLGVATERELDDVCRKLISGATREVKDFARSEPGERLGGMLKAFAKQALPIAGKAVGAAVGGPLGAKFGGATAKRIANMFELEVDGLSHEDRELEIAQKLVRIGAAAANEAARAPGQLPAQTIARRAFMSAARSHAPGLFRGGAPGPGGAPAGRDRSVRAGRNASVQDGVASARRRPNGTLRRGGAPSGPIEPAPALEDPAIDPAIVDSDESDPTVGELSVEPRPRGGRWFRRGRSIVLTGI